MTSLGLSHLVWLFPSHQKTELLFPLRWQIAGAALLDRVVTVLKQHTDVQVSGERALFGEAATTIRPQRCSQNRIPRDADGPLSKVKGLMTKYHDKIQCL